MSRIFVIVIIATLRSHERILICGASIHRGWSAWRAFVGARRWTIGSIHHFYWRLNCVFKCPSVRETLLYIKTRNLMTTNVQLMYQKSITFLLFIHWRSPFLFFQCNYRYYNFFLYVRGCHVITFYPHLFAFTLIRFSFRCLFDHLFQYH